MIYVFTIPSKRVIASISEARQCDDWNDKLIKNTYYSFNFVFVLVLILGNCIPKPKCSGVLVAFPGDRGSLPHNRALLGPEQGQKVIY